MNVYICSRCHGLVIFRFPWHQIYHLSSGWDCWKNSGGAASPLAGFDFSTPEEKRKALLKSFKKIYGKSEARVIVRPPFNFINDLWKQKKPDVIHDILGFLIDQEGALAIKLIEKIGKSGEWERYASIRIKFPIPRQRKK